MSFPRFMLATCSMCGCVVELAEGYVAEPHGSCPGSGRRPGRFEKIRIEAEAKAFWRKEDSNAK